MNDVPKELRLVIKIRKDLHMTPKKAAAQAVHAALKLVGSHHGGPVIVLDGTKRQITDCEVHIIDEGRTEVAPNSVTAGAYWDERPVPPEKLAAWEAEKALDTSREESVGSKKYQDAVREIQSIVDNIPYFMDVEFGEELEDWLKKNA